MFRFIEVHLVYVGCQSARHNLFICGWKSIRGLLPSLRPVLWDSCVNWSRQSTLLIKENSLHHRAQGVNLSLLFLRQQIIMSLVTKRVKMAGHEQSSFLVLFLSFLCLHPAKIMQPYVWPVLKTSEGVKFIPVIFHCDESFSPHYHRTIRFWVPEQMVNSSEFEITGDGLWLEGQLLSLKGKITSSEYKLHSTCRLSFSLEKARNKSVLAVKMILRKMNKFC